MINILNNKIINSIENSPNSVRLVNCSAMGMNKLNIEYNQKVTFGINYLVG